MLYGNLLISIYQIEYPDTTSHKTHNIKQHHQFKSITSMRPATLYAPFIAVLAALASSSPTDTGELAKRDAILAEFHAMEKRAGEIHARGEDYGWYRK